MDESTQISRRATLAKLGGLLAGAVAVGGLKTADSLSATEEEASGAGPAGVESGAVTCVLAPEQTEGPYYLDDASVRRNVTEGKAGVPLVLRLSVVSASTCKPSKGAAVEIWHCDAGGIYSGTSVQGTQDERFLRGVQRTDAKGLALFRTIYPGWYPGRAVHIHFKIRSGNSEFTSQFFFDDAFSEQVFTQAPYSAKGAGFLRNPNDGIYRQSNGQTTLQVTRSGSAYAASFDIGMQGV